MTPAAIHARIALTAADRARLKARHLLEDAPDRDYSTVEAARTLGITPKLIRSAIYRGELPAHQWGPHALRITWSNLMDWKECCRQAALRPKKTVTAGTAGTTGTELNPASDMRLKRVSESSEIQKLHL